MSRKQECRNRKLRRFVPAVLVLTLVASVATFAQPPERARIGDRWVERLELSDVQQQALRDALRVHREGSVDQRQQMRALRATLRDLVWSEAPDEAAIRDTVVAISELQADKAVERANFVREVRGVLNEEQFEEFRRLWQSRKGRQHHRGRGARGSNG